MSRVRVTSREYKAMLRADRFAAGDESLAAGGAALWSFVGELSVDVVVEAKGDAWRLEKERLVRFLDTAPLGLNAAGYVLRERTSPRGRKREATLKFRHGDRYVAQDREMTTTGGRRVRTKFEEDLKPLPPDCSYPCISLFSHSTTQRLARKRRLETVGDIVDLYPGLKCTRGSTRLEDRLEVVGGFTAREVVLTGPAWVLGKKPRVVAECALIAWYDASSPVPDPALVEFSFRYGDRRERYDRGPAARAREIMRVLRDSCEPWVDRDSPTKTGFVYGLAGL